MAVRACTFSSTARCQFTSARETSGTESQMPDVAREGANCGTDSVGMLEGPEDDARHRSARAETASALPSRSHETGRSFLEGKADEIRAQTTSPAFPSLPRRPDETDPKRLQPRPRILVNPFPFLLRFLLRLEPPGDMNVFHAALLVNDPVSACFGR
jgi:hypothetical protein